MSDTPYEIIRPKGARRPILISAPHVGVEIPPDVASRMRPEVARGVEDTDWLVHELYGFAAELGITLIHARYSRFLIDLNRDPSGRKLYHDGRAETALVPVRTFAREPIYAAASQEPDTAEVERRHELYFEPYHARVAEELRTLRTQRGQVLFFDAHSIKRHVPSIRPEPFPDLILGDQNGSTAAPALSQAALGALKDGGYDVSYNAPFMGGYLTRSIGQPATGVHALQLEMSQDVYLADGPSHDEEGRPCVRLDAGRLERLTPTLRSMLERLATLVDAL